MREITLVLRLTEEASEEYADLTTQHVIEGFLRVSEGAFLDVVEDNEFGAP